MFLISLLIHFVSFGIIYRTLDSIAVLWCIHIKNICRILTTTCEKQGLEDASIELQALNT